MRTHATRLVRRATALLVLAVLGAAPLRAEEPATPQQAAEAVAQAVATKDEAALQALAAKDDPDPWLVADELLGRGEVDAAAAFAKGAPRADVEALPAYVEGQRGAAPAPERRRVLAAYNAAIQTQGPAAAREALGEREPGPIQDVLGIRLLWSHAVLAIQADDPAGLSILREVGEAAQRLGWLRRAATAFHEAGVSAFRRDDMRGAAAAWGEACAAMERRGDRHGAATTAAKLGTAAVNAGDDARAVRALRRALEAPEALVEFGGASAARQMLVDALTRSERHAEALAEAVRLVEDLERGGEPAELTNALMSLGTAQRLTGDLAAAAATFERLLPRLEADGNAAGLAAVKSDLGQTLVTLGQNAKAKPLLVSALAGLEAAGNPGYAAITQMALGEAALVLGELDLALASHQQANARFAELGFAPQAAESRFALGKVREARGEWAEAAASYEQAAAEFVALGTTSWAAMSRAALAAVWVRQGRMDDAFRLWDEVVAAQEASSSKAGLVKTLCEYGAARSDRGDFREAARLLERAQAAARESGDAYGVRMARAQVGRIQYREGRYPEALATWGAVLAEEQAAADHLNAAATLSNLGLVHSALGDFAAALDVYGRALVLQREMGNRSNAAITLSNLASVHFQRGDLAAALRAYEEAHAQYEALGEPEGAAQMLARIGRVHVELGDLDRALAFQRRARDALLAIGDHFGAVGPLATIAHIEHERGDSAAARLLLEPAIAAEEKRGNRPTAAALRVDLARVLGELGDDEAAQRVLAEALAAGDALSSPSIAAYAQLELGRLHAARGRAREAREVLGDAHARLAALGSVRDEAYALGLLAGVEADLGDAAAALATSRRAVAAAAQGARGLGAEEGARVREPLALVYENGLRAARLTGEAGEVAFFLESGRAGALLEGLNARETLWAAAVPAELRAAEGRARAAEALATQALARAGAAGDKAEVRARRQGLAAAREEVARAIARIQREAKAGAALVAPEPRDLAGIQAALEPGDALVLFGMDAEAALALVVTPATARVVDLGPRRELDDAAGALDLTSADGDPAAALAALRRLVVAPLALGAETRRVLVSPAGALALVPFSTLLPDVPVVYVPSGTTYALLREDRAPRGVGVLALGDPDYASAAAVAVRGGKPLASLPATRAEAQAVGTVTLLGADATEAGLRAALARGERWRAVHLACHGLVNLDRPALSALALSPDAAEDGLLMALDVYRMRVPADLVTLSACETARGAVVATEGIVGLTRAFMFAGAPRVLCSLWKVDDEATASLMKKFYELWLGSPREAVAPSEPGAAPGESRGRSPADALRAAQEHVRGQEKWKHPYYWAAWVLWGMP
jgi:tetratricopeptide (TPR) repeat protein